jgi:methyl-accepting chemotaxis protein
LYGAANSRHRNPNRQLNGDHADVALGLLAEASPPRRHARPAFPGRNEKDIAMPFLNLRIKGRLYGGFCALALSGILLACFAVWELGAIAGHVERMGGQSQNAIRVVQISSELQAVRRAILRYQFDHDESSYAEAEKRLTDIGDMLDAAIRETSSDERRAAYRELQKTAAALKEKRAALGEAVRQFVAGRDALFSAGDQMAADMQKFVDVARETAFALAADSLESRILLVRVANWRFLATRDPKGRDTFETSVGKALAEIAELEKHDLSPNLQALLAPVKTGVAKYAAAFEKASVSMLSGDDIYYNAVTPITRAAVEQIDGIQTAIHAAFADTTRDAKDRIAGSMTVQEIITGVSVLLSLLIAYVIARGITNPLEELIGDAGRLSSGDTTAEFNTAQRGDEIGQVSAAVAKFRDNVIAQQQAAKSFASEVEHRAKMTRNMDCSPTSAKTPAC